MLLLHTYCENMCFHYYVIITRYYGYYVLLTPDFAEAVRQTSCSPQHRSTRTREPKRQGPGAQSPPLEEHPLFDHTGSQMDGDFDPWDPRRRSRLLLAVESRRRQPVTAVTAGHDAVSSLARGRQLPSRVTAAPGLGQSHSRRSANADDRGRRELTQGGGPHSDVWIPLLPPEGALGACVEERARSPLVVPG
jgi:hypothetical protein